MVYTLQERVELVRLYYQNQNCARAAARIFNRNHPERSVRHKYVMELISKFVETGSVKDKKRVPIGIVNDEGAAVAVLGHVQLMPNTQSVRQLSAVSGISQSNVFRILHKYKFHRYKFKLIHELNEDDFDRRQEFCEIMAERINNNPNFLYNVCFSDECTFSFNGEVKRHNCRIWSDTNPHVFREAHTQHPEKLNVWVGILGDHIIGHLFIPGNLNGEIYLEMLENTIDPLITEKLENDPLLIEEQLHFQQDGAPPHYAAPVRQYLNLQYPGRWIGRRGPMEWPARSPDLNPLDFFLWGHLKSKIFVTQPENLDELRQRIVNECRQITPLILDHVRDGFQSRLHYCMEVNGGQFEHLI